ncbi:MAG: hypothetical protein ABL986_14355 [Vicinamibacterales bacterium]
MTSRIIVVALTCLAGIGCGGNDSPTAPSAQTPTAAAITATVIPNPVIAIACTPTTCAAGLEFIASLSVQISETAGLGGNVDFVNVTMRNATTGAEIGTLNYGADELIRRASTNHVNARGSLTIPNVGIVYRLAGGGRQGTVTVAVQFTDDRGNRLNQIISVPVA